MGRPDKSEQRIGELLDAFEKLVARHGLEGTTLEMVANEAGVQRSLIRHYLGNRESVLVAWAERSVARYRHELNQLRAVLPNRNRSRTMIKYLFMHESSGTKDAELVLDVLIANSDRNARCRKLVADFIQEMVCCVADELGVEHVSAKKAECFEVANAIVAMSFCSESLSPLRLPTKHMKAWKKAALKLADGLSDR